MSDFRKLRAWQAAQALVIDAHRVSMKMRGAGNLTLRDQITRAVMSVSSNIVEGCAHESPREFARFLRYAIASVSEVEGHVQTGHDLGMIIEADSSALIAQAVDVRKMLYGLVKKLRETGNGPRAADNA